MTHNIQIMMIQELRDLPGGVLIYILSIPQLSYNMQYLIEIIIIQ